MEISPNELCNMLSSVSESSNEEVVELVDTYLCTTIDMLIEAVHKRVTTCKDKSKRHVFCNRLMDSLLVQLDPLRDTDLLSNNGKKLLREMEVKCHKEKE
jgi:hypothetical protein